MWWVKNDYIIIDPCVRECVRKDIHERLGVMVVSYGGCKGCGKDEIINSERICTKIDAFTVFLDSSKLYQCVMIAAKSYIHNPIFAEVNQQYHIISMDFLIVPPRWEEETEESEVPIITTILSTASRVRDLLCDGMLLHSVRSQVDTRRARPFQCDGKNEKGKRGGVKESI